MIQNIIKFALRIIARSVLKKYSPMIIAITGSVGKTSTREAVFKVVSQQFRARRSMHSYNNEFGVPLTVLECKSPRRNVIRWFRVLWRGIALLVKKDEFYPEALVLEFGADRPGDIQRLAALARPRIGIITAIGKIPAHVEFFSGPKAVAKEKANLVRALGIEGFAILNFDDDVVLDMKRETSARILTFGFGEGARIRAVSLRYKHFEEGRMGVSFTLEHNGKRIKMDLPGILGRQQVYSILAAYALGVALGMKSADIRSALITFEAVPGRMKLLEGIKKVWIIDDSYNASPLAMRAALDVLHSLRAKRKIAVLGDMREIGKYAFEAHQTIGDMATTIVDMLVCIGDAGKVIQQQAIAKGLDAKQVFWFDVDALPEAASMLQKILKQGDVVLIKASRALHLERIVKAIMAHPEKADTLLVHQ